MAANKFARKRRRHAARSKAIAQTNAQNGETSKSDNRERMISRGSAIGSLVHLGLTWVVVAVLVFVASHSRANPEHHQHSKVIEMDGYIIPSDTLGSWMEYPNPLNITDADRQHFHPVVVFPKVWVDVPEKDGDERNTNRRPKREKVANYQIIDLTSSSAATQLASEEERQARRLGKARKRETKQDYAVGRYDENRVTLYVSDLFDDTSNSIDEFAGARTVHVGIDIGGPVGTKVYAFADGAVHSAGYNSELGDYGNVIVIEHNLGPAVSGPLNGQARKIWALYGHLDDKSIVGKTKGKKITKGQLIGRFGDIHENGGWYSPHVHFQLSTHPPETHDMPGVVSIEDRPRALINYPDPRQVLGPLY